MSETVRLIKKNKDWEGKLKLVCIAFGVDQEEVADKIEDTPDWMVADHYYSEGSIDKNVSMNLLNIT